MAGETKFQREPGQISDAAGDFLERLAQSQVVKLSMKAETGFVPENAGEMKRRTKDRARDAAEGDLFPKRFCEDNPGRMSQVAMRFSRRGPTRFRRTPLLSRRNRSRLDQ